MRKVVFLDRDGTINVDRGFVQSRDQWEFTEQAPAALKKLQDSGYALGIITNQSGIARGLYTAADMRAVHEYMSEELAKDGVTIDAIAFCPHDRDSTCDCRKPMPGMAKHIEEQIGAIDYANSWTIGDKTVDMEFGQSVGTRTALIRSKYWVEAILTVKPDLIVDSLFDAAEKITSDNFQ